MRVVVVTPAGRARYLALLAKHLAAQKVDFDEWHLWLNANDPEDLRYCHRLAEEHEWIKAVPCPVPVPSYSCMTIHHFFPACADPDTLYLRLDDDIVYLEPGFVAKMVQARLAHPDHFLVYANVINNAVITHLHQRNKRFAYPRSVGYACMDEVGWNDPRCAEALHRAFLKSVHEGRLDDWHASFGAWDCIHHERVSINAICWLGRQFAEFEGRVGAEEEQWLSVDKPSATGRTNLIYGGAICVHFAFYTQRAHLDDTDLLAAYEALADKAPSGTPASGPPSGGPGRQ